MLGIIGHAPFPWLALLPPHSHAESHTASAHVPHPPLCRVSPAVLQSPGGQITWYKARTETIKCGNIGGEGGAFFGKKKCIELFLIQNTYHRDENAMLKFLALILGVDFYTYF